MPFIIIDGPELNKETKERLIKELTKKASEILNMPSNTINIIIKENKPDNVGVGGKVLSDIIKTNK